MRALDPAITARFAAREGINARLLAWIEAKDRTTGAPAPLGVWTGDDHMNFTIAGATRTYHGAGALLSMPPIRSETGLNVRRHRINLSPIAPEVEQAIRGYEPRLAPVELHVAYFDAAGALLAEPVRVFKGFVNTVRITTPEQGGAATVEVELLSAAHALTRALALKKSHESLIARAPGDNFRRYTAVTGTVTTFWGEKRAAAPGKTTADTTPPAPEKDMGGNIIYPGR